MLLRTLDVFLAMLMCGVPLDAAVLNHTIEKMIVYKIEGPTPPPPELRQALRKDAHKMRGIVKFAAKYPSRDQQGSSTEDRPSHSHLASRLLQEAYHSQSMRDHVPQFLVPQQQQQPQRQQPLYLGADVVNKLLGEQQTATNLILDAAPNLIEHKPLYLGSTKEPQQKEDLQLSLKHQAYQQQEDDESSQYDYEYRVKDKDGNDFGHSEKRSGARTWGSYFVHLPDGRLKTVKYWADHTGYHAEVEYEGTAQHPQPADHH